MTYSPMVTELIREIRLAPLGPGHANEAVRSKLKNLTAAAAFAPENPDRDLAQACLAGLWLYHDFLDESHQISQDLETAEGGLLARPDASPRAGLRQQQVLVSPRRPA